MARGPARAGVSLVAALTLLWFSAAGAVAKGPDQAVVSGPGIDQPIVVRAPGSPDIGEHMSTLIMSSGIMDQLWCRTCSDLSAKRPAGELGSMYLIRYRVPSLIGGPTRWIEQQAYPFAKPRPLTYVAPGQRFWHQRTAGGWYEAGAQMRRLLVDVGVPRTPPPSSTSVDTAAVTPIWSSVAMGAAGIAVAIAIVTALVLLGRAWGRARSARTHAA